MDAPLDPEEVRLALDEFDRAFRPPLDAFRHALCGLAADTKEARAVADQPTRSIAYLCDEIRALPAQFRDYTMAIYSVDQPDFAPARLSELLAEVRRRVAPNADARSHDLLCAIDGPDAEVRTDAGLCVEVLAQLARNAVLYTPAGGTVRVIVASRGPVWRMTVCDDGPGIPAKLRERMFEPFERLSRDVQAELPGAGLGLPLCRALVQRMGGTLSLDCPPDGGTVATVDLPAT